MSKYGITSAFFSSDPVYFGEYPAPGPIEKDNPFGWGGPNARAVELATENAKTNHTPYVRILTSDGWNGIEGSFSTVITNPPVRAGKKTIFSFYDGAYNRITPGGKLYVVLQKKQGAPSSEAYLRELFGNCEMIARDAGYWILRSVRTPESDS